ncbi:MAG: UrcA family protein [Phenylobacterium sp.]|uniref:UrcA family protein n=1 Tax=Phenylobacterium sp. TaxID=1871053 RepID=UPI00391AB4C2
MLKPLAGALALALAAAPAFAATAVVRISDLDLSKAADAAKLETRLTAAALSVCGAHEFSARAMKQAIARSDCYAETRAAAAAQARMALAAR